ncbi:glycosyl transferase, partial [Fomitiporia mediterranea MF3/22]|uniref:glycosyl transferase n=1 Tax=Fomitiporia mediterranea (strain MF3/22) TaxID=694068 RepID=UPI0004407E41
MRAFLTVGSTFFNELVDAVLSPSVLQALSNKGFEKLVIQCGTYQFKSKSNSGNSTQELWSWSEHGVEIEAWRYKPTLKEEYEVANLVISHAGSGTILDVLRLGKPMIVVPNPSLLDNHQSDLASELDKLGHLKASTTQTLAQDIETFAMNSLVPFPPMDQSKFRDILDEEMGFL